MKEKKEEVKAGQEKRQTRPHPRKERSADPVERTEEELVDLTSQVYKLVLERGKDGVLQSEVWKELGLSSRDGSRLAIRLERRGLIGRVKTLEEGRWTYKLRPLRFPTDMASIEKAPCITSPYESGCITNGEIDPLVCPSIGPWVIQEYRAARSQSQAKRAEKAEALIARGTWTTRRHGT